MNAVTEICIIGETLNKNFVVVTNLLRITNERTNEWKDENYIPLSINPGGIIKCFCVLKEACKLFRMCNHSKANFGLYTQGAL